MRCNKCGHKVKSGAAFCTHCGNRLNTDGLTQSAETIVDNHAILHTIKRYKKYIIIGLIAVCTIGYFFGVRCKSGLCLLPRRPGGEYCAIHTCRWDDCTNKTVAGKDYCYTHAPSTSHSYTYTPTPEISEENAEDALKFSNIKVTNNRSYTVCTGKITNNGEKTYTFVKVKGKFETSSGTVIDTDWTYAVGAEGLAPGESTTFKMSVDKNSSIAKCSVEILDYDNE